MRHRRIPSSQAAPRSRAERRAWFAKLYNEAHMLGALGMLDQQGRTFCRECGLELDRPAGWNLHLVCACGWELHDL